LDILVNNAGVLRDKTLKNLTLDDWQIVLDTNLNGVFHTARRRTQFCGTKGGS